MTKEQKAIYKFAQELGRASIRNNLCRRAIRRRLALRRISHARADTLGTLNSKANVKCDPGEIVSNSAD